MKFLCSILIWVSLGFGAVAAATAYMPPTSLDDSMFMTVDDDVKAVPLEITEPAGVILDDGVPGGDPLFKKETPLTPEVLKVMREKGEDGERLVSRVKVSEFAWDRWSHKWHFAAALLGLLIGGLGSRFVAKAEARRQDPDKPVEETPAGALAASIAVLNAVLVELESKPDDDARLALIIDQLGELQQTHLAVFGDAREELIARMGLGRFAAMMDRFALGERAVNRAWSAAADGRVGPARDMADLLAESEQNVNDAVEALTEAESRLG